VQCVERRQLILWRRLSLNDEAAHTHTVPKTEIDTF
jgi:hypothetical protein